MTPAEETKDLIIKTWQMFSHRAVKKYRENNVKELCVMALSSISDLKQYECCMPINKQWPAVSHNEAMRLELVGTSLETDNTDNRQQKPKDGRHIDKEQENC